MITNTGFAANIQNCDRITFAARTIDMYDRLLKPGGVAIICNNTQNSRFDIGTTHKVAGSSSATAFVEQGTSDYNYVTGDFDGAVSLIGANSIFAGIDH